MNESDYIREIEESECEGEEERMEKEILIG